MGGDRVPVEHKDLAGGVQELRAEQARWGSQEAEDQTGLGLPHQPQTRSEGGHGVTLPESLPFPAGPGGYS